MSQSEQSEKLESLLVEGERVIRAGGVVLVPTETFYALAADPRQEEAVRRIFRIKNRDEANALPLIATSRSAVDDVVATPDGRTQELMSRFWPGSLTILLRPNIELSRLLIGNRGLIAIRVPPRCPARELADRAGGIITATSANLSGGPNPDQVSRIDLSVVSAVDLVMDLGPTGGTKPSTVVEPLGDSLDIRREGVVPGSVLEEFYRLCLKRLDKDF